MRLDKERGTQEAREEKRGERWRHETRQGKEAKDWLRLNRGEV